jgi:cytochrome c-type biogenesis protein CcmE
MNRRLIKTGIIVSAVAGTLVYLIVSSFGESMIYYKTVNEILAERNRFENETVRVNGLFKKGSLKQKPNTDEYKFDLLKNGKSLTVVYSGILPDNLKPGVEMVVQGKLVAGKNVFNATEILTKCPSKYEKTAESKNIKGTAK